MTGFPLKGLGELPRRTRWSFFEAAPNIGDGWTLVVGTRSRKRINGDNNIYDRVLADDMKTIAIYYMA